MKKIQILQHYEPLLLKIESDVLAIAGSGQSHRGDPATLESMINAASNEVQTATRMLVLDGMKLRSREGSDLSIARLYEGLNQERVSKSRFLEEIEARKTRLLKRLEQEQSERSSVSKNVRSRASSLLKTFQGHHDERVAEVESVLNQVESCEHERDRLYTKMRQEAQRRLLERRPNDHLQELEETKAHIRGLCSALEFVQSEQLNMVERVVSIEDQSKTLEDMKRTSRSMDLKLAEVQFQMDKLMEMIRLSRQSSSDISNDTALYVTDAIGHRLARLSEMVQQRRAKVETEMDIVKDTISACQQRPQNCVLEILPPDMDAALENEAQKGTNALSMYSVVSDSSLSREQVIVQLSALQQQIAVQSLASTKAKEQAQKMKQAMDSLTTGMKQSVANFSRQVPQESLSQASEAAAGDEDGQLNADNLCSTFEKEVKSAARFVFNLQSVQHHEFSHGVKGILHELQDNKSIIQDIQNVIADGEILHNNNETTTHNDATHYVSSKTGTERKRARLSTK
ncbi:hypothetical protein BG004_005720 [Podila humilis]|nr:hypothetical protein BG004_005720 [Podila humilis]